MLAEPLPGVPLPIVGAPGAVAPAITSSVIDCGGSVSDSAEDDSGTSAGWVMVFVEVSCQRWPAAVRWGTKPDRLTVAGVSPVSDLEMSITVSAASLERTAAKAATL